MQSAVELLLALARVGRTADVERLAADLLKQAGTDRQVLFQTACGLAIVGRDSDAASVRCRDEAFRVMGMLVERGWKDRVALQTDPDFAGVRHDKRFGELLTRLDQKPGQAE